MPAHLRHDQEGAHSGLWRARQGSADEGDQGADDEGEEGEVVYTFAPLDSYELSGKGTVYIVRNPWECVDFSHLIGKEAEIGWRVFRIVAVERFAHGAPWVAGEPIGLLVAAPKHSS